MTTTTLQALLAAVIREPDCDVVRYAYADALEEEGSESGMWRASMIRGTWDIMGPSRFTTTFPEVACLVGKSDARIVIDGILHFDGIASGVVIEIRRGFVESVTCTMAEFMEHGPAIVRAAPLVRVTFSDKEPSHRADLWWWFADRHPDSYAEHDDLPDELCRHFIDDEAHYRTRELALGALSSVAIRWAKAQPLAIASDADA